MHCKNCGGEISLGASFCSKCGTKIESEISTNSESRVKQTTVASRLLTAPNYLFLGLFFAHFVSYLSKGYPPTFAAARAVGVNIIPLVFGIFFNFSGSKTSKVAYVVLTVLFMVIFAAATMQSAKDSH